MAVRVPPELTERDPAVLAPAAGLTHVTDDEPGYTRVRRGTGFSYVDAFAKHVRGAERDRVEALAVPPAWNDVWLCADPDGYLQASGYDDAGRKQYRYHDDYRAFAEQRKFERLRYFGRASRAIRRGVVEALDAPVGSRDHAVAAAVRLIDRCLLRVGNHQSAANGHYGATTLTVEHVVADGVLTLEYRGKSGQDREVVVADDELAATLLALAGDADDELFWFEDDDGERRRASADDINRFVVEHAGPAFTAKDFRTWGGSAIALAARVEGARPLDAIDEAAAELGNTRAVARSSYIHPRVLDAEVDELHDVWSRSRGSKWADRAEQALDKLIGA